MIAVTRRLIAGKQQACDQRLASVDLRYWRVSLVGRSTPDCWRGGAGYGW